MHEVLVLKSPIRRTSHRVKWTLGARDMISYFPIFNFHFDRWSAQSCDRSIARSLDRSIARLLGRAAARSPRRTAARSLDRSIARTDERTVARALDRLDGRTDGRKVARSLGRPTHGRSIARVFSMKLNIGNVLERLVLKNLHQCTDQHVKWTSGARVMIDSFRSLDRSLDRCIARYDLPICPVSELVWLPGCEIYPVS